jgi:hypothetical protein
MKKLLLISMFFTFTFLLLPLSFATETLEILTYYPAPYGVYQTLEVKRSDSTSASLLISNYNDTATIFPSLSLRKADGTMSTATAVDQNETLGSINLMGCYSTNNFANGARIYALADNNWSSTEKGTELRFQTRDGNDTDLSDRIIIKANGSTGVKTGYPSASFDPTSLPYSTAFFASSKNDIDSQSACGIFGEVYDYSNTGFTTGYGVKGYSHSVNNNAQMVGVSGEAIGAWAGNLNNYVTGGQFSALNSTSARDVTGINISAQNEYTLSPTGTCYGGDFVTQSYGKNYGIDSTVNMLGSPNTKEGRGINSYIYGECTNAIYGLYSSVINTKNTDPTGATYGIYSTASKYAGNTATYGIYSDTYSLGTATGIDYGVYGLASSNGDVGANIGVYGKTNSTTAQTAGVRGSGPGGSYGCIGTKQFHAGVYKQMGVYGTAYAGLDGGASRPPVSVYGEVLDTSVAGAIGVAGYCGNLNGWAGYFGGKVGCTAANPAAASQKYMYTGDIAELIPCSKNVEVCDVVVTNPEKDQELIKSTKANDYTVAGIISENPQFCFGDKEQYKDMAENLQYLALGGQVKVKADASYGEIKRGDLLTTSDTPGHAMKAKPIGEINGHPIYPQGCIVGKALEPLKEGKGKILVLVCLM